MCRLCAECALGMPRMRLASRAHHSFFESKFKAPKTPLSHGFRGLAAIKARAKKKGDFQGAGGFGATLSIAAFRCWPGKRRGFDGGGFPGGGFEADRLAAPDFFQLVVLAQGGLHDVGDDGAAVHNDPFAVVFAH